MIKRWWPLLAVLAYVVLYIVAQGGLDAWAGVDYVVYGLGCAGWGAVGFLRDEWRRDADDIARRVALELYGDFTHDDAQPVQAAVRRVLRAVREGRE